MWFPKGFWKVPLKSLSGQPSNCCKNKYVTRRQSEWPVLTAEGNCQEFCRNLCWNYDTHISFITNSGTGVSCKIKLLRGINFFWVTRARVSWRIVKIKQVDYRMAHGIQGMKNVKSNGDYPDFIHIRMSPVLTITSQECSLGCCEKLLYKNLSWMLISYKKQSKWLEHSCEVCKLEVCTTLSMMRSPRPHLWRRGNYKTSN